MQKKFKTPKELFDKIEIGNIISYSDTPLAIVLDKIGPDASYSVSVNDFTSYILKVIRLKATRFTSKKSTKFYIHSASLQEYKILK